MKKPVKIKPEFILTKEELKIYRELPDNMPDIKLTAKQIEAVNGLYHKYITKQIDNTSWNVAMYEIEKREKWPSGPRVKAHEAKRFILNNLVELNENHKALTIKEAMIKFYCVIELRPMYSKLVKLVYDISEVDK